LDRSFEGPGAKNTLLWRGDTIVGIAIAAWVLILSIYYKVVFELNWGISFFGAIAVAVCTTILLAAGTLLYEIRSHSAHMSKGPQNGRWSIRLDVLFLFVMIAIINALLSKIVFCSFSIDANNQLCTGNELIFYLGSSAEDFIFTGLTFIPILTYQFLCSPAIYNAAREDD
jgi:hypothetical protein